MSEKEPKGYQKEQVDAAYKFAARKITLEKFISYNPIGQGLKWKQLKYLKKTPYLWSQLLLNLPVHLRLKALLDAEGISFKLLEESMGITNAEDYINNENFIFKSTGISHTLMKLAIIFDIPLKFVLSSSPKGIDLTEFHEYQYSLMGKPKSILDDLISWSLKEMHYRNINGYIVDNSTQVFPFIDNNQAFVRVDKNVGFFSFEIFLTSQIYPNADELKILIGKFNNLVDSIYIVDSLLRNAPKLTIIGVYKPLKLENLKNHVEILNEQLRTEKIYPF